MFDVPLTTAQTQDQRRSLRWLAYCEHTAVLAWLPEVLRLAQAAEDDRTYRSTLATQARLKAEAADLVDELWALDPDWAMVVLGQRNVYPRGYTGPRWDWGEEEGAPGG